jgi:hypothetical protein
MKRAATFVAIAVLMHSGASSAVERKGLPNASQLITKEPTVKTLSESECKALGGEVVRHYTICDSFEACKTTDQNGTVHRVCITK